MNHRNGVAMGNDLIKNTLSLPHEPSKLNVNNEESEQVSLGMLFRGC